MIGALVAVLSLNMTLSLIQNYGQVAGTLPITGATTTTPILVTSPNHGVPPARVVHGVVDQVSGTTEANGLWIATPVDSNTLSLSTFDAQGNVVQSVGVNAYAGGGRLRYAFPDYGILLGRQLLNLSTAVASPRIAFVPTKNGPWVYESEGSVGQTVAEQRSTGTAEQQYMTLHKQYATEPVTFEVYVTGAANPPAPNFGDFDATQLLVHVLYATLFEAVTSPVARIVQADWPSQKADSATMLQRGQMWMGIVEIKQPVTAIPKSFVPAGTSIVFTVEPENPLVPQDQTTITIPGV
jgi:hypothetical protein